MMLSTIVVHLDDSPQCATRMQWAAQLAGAHRAQLIGLAAPGIGLSPPADRQASIESLVSAFERGATEQQLPQATARRDDRPIDQALAELALACDLVVMGQDASEDALSPGLVQRILMRSGCPVLMLPRRGEPVRPVGRVMIAWDGSRAASRSVRDALPLLAKAEEVHLVCLQRSQSPVVSRLQLNDVRHWLARHRVDVRLHWEPVNDDIGEELLLRATRLKADLVVMGGYGHSPLAEALLGGVTRTLLWRTHVPLFLSH